jgi:predicted transcriptional regulator
MQMSLERISDAELTIMEILWEQAPLTATDVAARLPADRDWSLPTVKTLLSRLLSKAAVEHRADGRRFLYSNPSGWSTGCSGASSCRWSRISQSRISSAMPTSARSRNC